VGSSLSMSVDVRVIATTNRDLTRSVADGTFRQDLFYRLNVLPLRLPPLRERTEDIPLLADHFLNQVGQREGRQPKAFDDEAVDLMRRYPWPGNVRELQNICERASVLSRHNRIPAGLIQPWLLTPGPARRFTPADATAPGRAGVAAPTGSPPLQAPGGESDFGVAPQDALATLPDAQPVVRSLEEIEREQVVRALGQFNGNRTHAAKALGIGVRTLGLKLKKWKQENLVAQSL